MQKIARATSVSVTYCLEHWKKEMKERTKNIKFLIVDYFSLALVNLFISLIVVLPCMTSEYQKILSSE